MNQALLETVYNEALGTDDFEVHQAFIKLLLSESDEASLEFHYNKLRSQKNRELHLRLRLAFIKRGEEGARYLVERIADEKDTAMQGDLLHMLGRLRHPAGLQMARASLSSNERETRHHACCVLGWMGEKADVTLLLTPLLKDAEPYVRTAATTAHSQIYDRLPELKAPLLQNLKQAFDAERDDTTMGWVIITIQYILKKRFGLREDIGSATLIGNLESAKKKCHQALVQMV